MCNICAVGISFILLFCLFSDKQDSPLNLKIFCVIYSQGNHLADCHSSNICLFARDFKSEKGLSSTRDIANEGILSSRVCSQIFPNVHMAGDPDRKERNKRSIAKPFELDDTENVFVNHLQLSIFARNGGLELC